MIGRLRIAMLGLGCVGCICPAAGCGPKPNVHIPAGISQAQGPDEALKAIRADPIRFLQDSLAKARGLHQFTSHFQRQERLGLGLFAELKPLENIFAEYRDRPFSVRFTWLDHDSEYLQCVFVDGKYDDKVVLLPRSGWFGLPPSVARYPPELAVIWGKTRSPITDFGPRRLMERTLDRIEKAEPHGGAAIRVFPPTEIGPAKEPCYHFEIRYPRGDAFVTKLQDLYIHADTHLPVATYLWLPGHPERTETTLDAMYVYGDLNADAVLTEAHFAIDADRGERKTRAVLEPVGDRGSQAATPHGAISDQ